MGASFIHSNKSFMNLDKNQFFPNQWNSIENNKNECVGLTIADVLGNAIGQLMDPDFPYSLGFYINGQSPDDGGIDPYSALQATVAYGILPVSMETWSAKTTSELYAANFQNFTPDQVKEALPFAQNGIKKLVTYKDVQNYLSTYKQGVVLAMDWYKSFNIPNTDGTLPAPVGLNSKHAVAVYEDIDGKGLRVKPWVGQQYGDNGYCYMSEATFNLVSQGAWGFTPDVWRWPNLAWIAATHPRIISDVLPQLKTFS